MILLIPSAVGWPDCAATPEERSLLVKELHLLKTALFNQAIVDGEIPLRKGVIRLVDEAIFNNVPLVSSVVHTHIQECYRGSL